MLGETINARRKEAGLTLVALAEAAGLSHPFLSQIENGRAQPSIESLRRIADALATTPQALFGAPEDASPAVVRGADAPTLEVAGAAAGSVARTHLGGDAPFHLVELDGLPRQFQDHWSHAGFEAVYVVSGTVEIELDGQVTVLAAGDSGSYPADVPHRLRQLGRRRARVLLIETPLTNTAGQHARVAAAAP